MDPAERFATRGVSQTQGHTVTELGAARQAAWNPMPALAVGCIQCPKGSGGKREATLPCGHTPVLCWGCRDEAQRAVEAGEITSDVLRLLCPECCSGS